MRLRARTALVVVTLAGTAACSRVKQVPSDQGKPEAEAPPDSAGKGVPPRGASPRVPAAPDALLADGAVREIQRALAGRGLLRGHREGDLDAPTSAALRKFQADEGLAATGFPDRETVRRLGLDPEEAYRTSGQSPRR